MKKVITSSIITALFLLITTTIELAAQGRSNDRPGRSGEAPGRNKGATGVPIDGGVGVLLAAGAAYGIKKLRDYRSNNRDNNLKI